jgi:ferric-dicitrate binding protein FerR (iron transport regulator)
MMNLNNESNNIENLVLTYLNGVISDQEKNELFQWLVEDPSNLTHFNQIADIWLSSSVFQVTQSFNSDIAFERVKAKISDANLFVGESKRRNIQLPWYWAAAILVIVIFSSVLASNFLFKEPVKYSASTYLFEVPYGSKSNLRLPDGSSVILNAGSKLTISEGFGKTHRNLNLIGEGYFKVSSNKALPFLVHAGKIEVKALGTEFNVKAYPEDKVIETILIEGSVEVNKMGNAGSEPQGFLLLPKQTLVYNKELDDIKVNVLVNTSSPVEKKLVPVDPLPKIEYIQSNIDPEIYTSWKEVSWNIYRKNLLDLATELERKYDVTIRFENEALKTIKFTGTLKDESLEQVLSAMRIASPIEYKITGKIVELKENRALMEQYEQYYSDNK